MDWQAITQRIEVAVAPHIGTGKVADYIPALARVDPCKFGMAIVLGDGTMVTLGDSHEPFSIQSISKVFTLSMALRHYDEKVWDRVGREPSGSAFNSIVQLENEKGIPRNPLINAGAIVVTDMLVAQGGSAAFEAELMARFHRLSGDDSISVDEEVAESESATGSRNRALAHFMAAFGNMANPVEESLQAYFRQCAVRMSCRQLARAALFLAFDGCDPINRERLVSRENCRRINAVMMSCGHYDNSGDFAYRIGLPGKSGVGGGILCIAPGHGAIAVWSPGLNASGTSMVGAIALEELVEATGWSVFV
ncbi:L-glutaminase [Blastomonas natatoria]|uniref:Glutaminase n=1 Tax=Blastomonas natatoria TaxID=34015 RepID=A0A2V3UY95_9SPHN|nr:glutaminase [Blastomonas natatoria]PXW74376.1 L-glutaminase [Blastomonas natatoria]